MLKKLKTSREWHELILNSNTMKQVERIKIRLDHFKTKHNQKHHPKIKSSVSCLFCGPPGTGKTLTASLLGKVSGLEVYRIDLSMIVSKYIGETEKNLNKLFNKAEHKDWILFFDEADALFGKRIEVKGAHDRYTNIETSYFLQRIESFHGVVILTTNLIKNVDPAFIRRLQYVVDFPNPEVDERQRLWKNYFSNEISREDSVNIMDLARIYKLTGGQIKNVILFAKLKSKQRQGRKIYLDDIKEGINKEL